MLIRKMINNMYGDESGLPNPDITYVSGGGWGEIDDDNYYYYYYYWY